MSYANVARDARPQIALVPRQSRSDGDDAIELAESVGLVPDDWQRDALRGALGRVGGRRWAAGEVGLEVPRQNGKTVILQVRCLWGLWGTGERLVTWTAHEYKTAREAFLDLRHLIEDSALAADVAAIRTFPQLEIELRDGSRAIFLARTSGSGRGFSGDCVILDEAYKLNPEQMAALMPTLSARPDPQLWYASMAGLETSDHLRRVRDRAIAGARRLCYLGWSAVAPGEESAVDLDDRAGWQRANPGMPHRITWEAVEQEREALTEEDFARERLGIWSDTGLRSVLDADVWASLEDLRSRPGDPPAFGLDMPPDRSSAWIAVAGRRPDGRKHVELVPCCAFHDEHGGRCAGTAWVAKRVSQLEKRHKPLGWLLDPAAPAGSLIPALVKAGIEPVLIGQREMAQACGAVYDGVMADDPADRDIRHLGQPELNTAVDGARKRTLADAWAWHRRDATVNISPLVAITLAAHGVDKKPKRRRKTGRVMAA
jgi:hypothetical protein